MKASTHARAREARLRTRLEALAALTDPAAPYTRRAFTERYQEGRAYLAQEMKNAELDVYYDKASNLFGVRAGQVATTLMLGSHSDTVQDGGRFDGICGVLAALEVADMLRENAVELRHSLTVVDFLSEEPSDYGASCIGSRALVGTLSPQMLENTNPAGETLAAAIARMGGEPAALTGPLREPGEVAAFLELHIEQGPVLEKNNLSIGLVTGIVGIVRYRVTFLGQAAHAGTTPMPLRQDALVAASAFISQVDALARAQPAQAQLVATVGRLELFPNAANVIPGKVELVLEVRARTLETAQTFTKMLLGAFTKILPNASYTVETLSEAPATLSDSRLLKALENACAARGLLQQAMPSGAGHDAMQVSLIAPVAMVFIPCKDGLSHHPAEAAEIADLAKGAEVLYDAVLELDHALA